MTKYQATWGRNLQKKKPKKHEGFSQIKIFNLNLKKKTCYLNLKLIKRVHAAIFVISLTSYFDQQEERNKQIFTSLFFKSDKHKFTNLS